MNIWYFVSFFSLSGSMLLCFLGIFLPQRLYDDNLLETIGYSGVFLMCANRLSQLVAVGEFTARCVSAEAQIAGHVGLFCALLGVAIKAFRSHQTLRIA